ncbi:MAG: hypothetical protein IPO27_03570 [Bacteroidetes bacterium]|nr:hypothetical protein [Bacteroidota bacterium]
MKSLYLAIVMFTLSPSGLHLAAQDVSKKYLKNQTVTVAECNSFYFNLSDNFENVTINEEGLSDANRPIYSVLLTSDAKYDSTKLCLMIMNGIHPGEPCGIDASMNFAYWLLTESKAILSKINVIIIPIYNVDGAQNRNGFSRANQNGPEEYGFRGNAINLDLNRDFIKADSRNTLVFQQLFHRYKPHIFADTHISDGADYTYTMTLIDSQKDKISPVISSYMQQSFLPQLYKIMKKRNDEMIPYVETIDESPDSGIVAFMDGCRYSTGYTSLFNTFSFVTESHMLKPYPEQVQSTFNLLQSIAEYSSQHGNDIISIKKKAEEYTKTQKVFGLDWQLDKTKSDSLLFKGYGAEYVTSTVTNSPYIVYNRSKPYEKMIPYFNTYTATVTTKLPQAYVIPQQWEKVVERLRQSNIEMSRLNADTTILVTATYIKDYSSPKRPYENHHLHSKIELTRENHHVQFSKGDFVIYCNQAGNAYLANVLEANAPDGFFAWNFFDAILNQKEWFSPYLFQPIAQKLLSQNPELKSDFEKYVRDNKFEKNEWEQLAYIYRHSPYYEKSHNRYPVFRIE